LNQVDIASSALISADSHFDIVTKLHNVKQTLKHNKVCCNSLKQIGC